MSGRVPGRSPDDWTVLRAYCRGEQAGIARAVKEDLAGLACVELAQSALVAAGIPLTSELSPSRRSWATGLEIFELAVAEAREASPRLDPVQHRALGALRVARLVLAAIYAARGAGRACDE